MCRDHALFRRSGEVAEAARTAVSMAITLTAQCSGSPACGCAKVAWRRPTNLLAGVDGGDEAEQACDRRDYGTPCRICRGHERLGDLGLPYDLAIARFNLARADVQLVL